jgi:serine/threonine protein phosphatase PrpC
MSAPTIRLRIYSGEGSFIGTGRDRNEDASFQGRVSLGYLAAVADGMGGHEHGDTAARVTLDALVAAVDKETVDPVAALKAGFAAANQAVRDQSAARNAIMGATCVAALIAQGRLHVAHVGDARLYLLRGANLYSLTRDHSIFQEIADIKGPVAATGFAPTLKHIMSRSIGAEAQIAPDIRPPIPLTAGDTVLLCTDGVAGTLDERRIRRILAGGTAREAAARIAQAVESEGGEDNATAVVLRVDADADRELHGYLTFDSLLSMSVQTADGNLHPIVDAVVNPASWAVVALKLDLGQVEQNATCSIPITDIGPIAGPDQPLLTPQRTEALLDMGRGEDSGS